MLEEKTKTFKKTVLRPTLQTLLTAGCSTAILAFAVVTVSVENRLNDIVALNQWLARDIASQFTGVASQTLGRAQKFANLVRSESGTFDLAAQREFDADLSLKAVWILDATGAGPLQPLAKLERDDFTVSETQVESVRRLTELAIRDGSAIRGLAPGLSVLALKVGDMPRTILLFSDEALFSRARGGPWGDKWMLIAPSADKTEAVLVEASSELNEGLQFPSFDQIAALAVEESPTQERSEFSAEVSAANGSRFQVSGVRAGAFGVVSVAISPLDSPEAATNVALFMRLAMGITVAISLLVMLIQILRMPRSHVGVRRSAGEES